MSTSNYKEWGDQERLMRDALKEDDPNDTLNAEGRPKYFLKEIVIAPPTANQENDHQEILEALDKDDEISSNAPGDESPEKEDSDSMREIDPFVDEATSTGERNTSSKETRVVQRLRKAEDFDVYDQTIDKFKKKP